MAAIKGPRPQPLDVQRAGAQKGPPLGALESALLQSGIARTPVEARVLAKSLVAALKQAGFPPPPKGGADEQLRAFQRGNGLPVTGKLDDATRAKMADLGLLPKDAGQAKQTPAQPGGAKLEGAPAAPKGWSDFTPGPRPTARAPTTTTTTRPGERTHVVAHEQTRARAELAKDGTPKDLSRLLESLSQLGFFGGGKGKQRLEGALRGLQLSAGLPTTGKLDAGTVKELVRQGVLPEGTEASAQGRDKGGDGARASADGNARGQAAERAGAQQPRAANTQGQAPSDGRGVAEGKGDPRATEGRGETAGEAKGKGGHGGEGAPGALADGSGRVVGGDERGEAFDDANAPAGDEEWDDDRRGHATLDEESDDDEGYYEVPPLSRQVKEALDGIRRNDDESGAVTYSWDVTFYKPGVYGRRQPAEALWHLVVDRAGAFDPVWQRAKQALEERMAEIEPDGAPPSDDELVLALRRARVREGSLS